MNRMQRAALLLCLFLMVGFSNVYGWVEIKKAVVSDLHSSYPDMIFVYTSGSGGSGLGYEGLNVYKLDEDTANLKLVFSIRTMDSETDSLRDTEMVTTRTVEELEYGDESYRPLKVKTTEVQRDSEKESVISSKRLPDQLFIFDGNKYALSSERA